MNTIHKLKDRLLAYKNKKGFTLIELIVVMAIIAILVLLAAPRFIGQTDQALATQIKNDIRVAENKVTELLVTDDARVVEWDELSSNELDELVGDDVLYGRGGELITIEDGETYRQLDDAFISREINSSLDGGFFVNDEGDVLYLGGAVRTSGETEGSSDKTIPEHYVMAEESEFEKVDGYWRYKGEDTHVIIPHEIDGERVTSYRHMFRGTAIEGVASDNPNVTNMGFMFYGSSAETLDLSSFDTSNVTTMVGMFRDSGAKTLDLSSFDTSNVTNMQSMFSNSSATTLDLSSFDTSNVTDMSYMFRESNVKTLDLSSFDTSNVTTMSHMFRDSSATTLDLSSFDMSNVTSMTRMFSGSSVQTGYARNQTDADRLNSSSYKPSNLTFRLK